jgi:hypothetical protein
MPLSLGSKKGKKEQKKSFKEPFCSFCPFFASLVQLGEGDYLIPIFF